MQYQPPRPARPHPTSDNAAYAYHYWQTPAVYHVVHNGPVQLVGTSRVAHHRHAERFGRTSVHWISGRREHVRGTISQDIGDIQLSQQAKTVIASAGVRMVVSDRVPRTYQPPTLQIRRYRVVDSLTIDIAEGDRFVRYVKCANAWVR